MSARERERERGRGGRERKGEILDEHSLDNATRARVQPFELCDGVETGTSLPPRCAHSTVDLSHIRA